LKCGSGADGPALDKTPDFVKSVPVWKALEETTLVAYEMNGGRFDLAIRAPLYFAATISQWTAFALGAPGL
jgi:hypothetical protein